MGFSLFITVVGNVWVSPDDFESEWYEFQRVIACASLLSLYDLLSMIRTWV